MQPRQRSKWPTAAAVSGSLPSATASSGRCGRAASPSPRPTTGRSGTPAGRTRSGRSRRAGGACAVITDLPRSGRGSSRPSGIEPALQPLHDRERRRRRSPRVDRRARRRAQLAGRGLDDQRAALGDQRGARGDHGGDRAGRVDRARRRRSRAPSVAYQRERRRARRAARRPRRQPRSAARRPGPAAARRRAPRRAGARTLRPRRRRTAPRAGEPAARASSTQPRDLRRDAAAEALEPHARRRTRPALARAPARPRAPARAGAARRRDQRDHRLGGDVRRRPPCVVDLGQRMQPERRRARSGPSVPSEPHATFGRSKPATFFTTLPPPRATSPSARTSVTPMIRSRTAP